jgi:hypothetical protein
MDALFLTAGISMFLHLALGAILRRGLSNHPAIEDELFAVPNRLLGTPNFIRLLRVRYFMPFRALPEEAHRLKPWVRITLVATRITGLCFICAILGFFVAAFVEVGR